MGRTKPGDSKAIIASLRGTLIVSCQASQGEPLCAPEHIKALALSVIAGGARGLRLEGEENVRTVRSQTDLPIIGLSKTEGLTETERLKQVYITATIAQAQALARAGADVIAIDATARPRVNGDWSSDVCSSDLAKFTTCASYQSWLILARPRKHLMPSGWAPT